MLLSAEQITPYLVDSEAAGKILGVSPYSIERWGRDGVIPRIAMAHNLVRYRVSDLINYADKLATGTTQKKANAQSVAPENQAKPKRGRPRKPAIC